MNSTINQKLKVESAVVVTQRADANKRFSFPQKGTVAFLLLSSAVSIYEALFVSGTGSQFFIPLLAGGLGRIVVARFCILGKIGAYRTAIVFALATSAIDIVSSSGDYLYSALYVGPQALVVIFSLLALRQMRSTD